MTTIEDLAQTTAARYDIPTDPARKLVATYVDQISDDADLWDAGAQTLTADGVQVVTDAISEGYRHGLNSTAESRVLADLEETAAELRRAAEAVEALTAKRDQMVRTLMTTAVSRKTIAEAAGLKEARLYQIRDGRR